MTSLLVVLSVWVVLSGLAAAGFSMLMIGARRVEERSLLAPARGPAEPLMPTAA